MNTSNHDVLPTTNAKPTAAKSKLWRASSFALLVCFASHYVNSSSRYVQNLPVGRSTQAVAGQDETTMEHSHTSANVGASVSGNTVDARDALEQQAASEQSSQQQQQEQERKLAQAQEAQKQAKEDHQRAMALLNQTKQELAGKDKELETLRKALRKHQENLVEKEKGLEEYEKKLRQEKNHILRLVEEEELLKKQANPQQHLQITDKNQNHVSACAMVMDGNHELIEWLAFHYHTLPLRRLILFTDKASRTSPNAILKRWEGRINITLWEHSDIFADGKYSHANYADHKQRQKKFSGLCMKALYAEGQQWITVFDPDEFITVNEKAYNQTLPMYGLNTTSETLDLPTPREPGSTLEMVKKVIAYVHKYGTQGNRYLENFETPCININRKQFANYDDKQKYPSFPLNGVKGIGPMDLNTWRWHYWGKRETPIGKALVDFGRLRREEVFDNQATIHRPITNEDICRKAFAWTREQDAPLVMNHYSSTWEQMLFRAGDVRGGEEGRKARFKKDRQYRNFYETQPRIMEWLDGFIDSVGKEEAVRLLQHAGNPKTANVGAYRDPSQEPN